MASVRRSLALSFAQKYSTMVIGLISTMILARLLTPAEIGIFSVGVAFVGMAHMLRDFGVGSYLIQEKELTRDRIRTAFGVALVIAWTMAGILYGLSGPASRFYDEPGVRLVMEVLTINFLLIPFSSPILSLLNREMNFAALYRINVASVLVRASTSVALAYLGFGFISLAWGSIAGVATTVVVAALHRPGIARVLPGFSEWRRVVSFGTKMSVISLVGELAARTPELVIGRSLGFSAVGIYSRAEGAVLFFYRGLFGVIGPVVLPAFAGKSRSGEDILPSYLTAVNYLSAITWPLFAFLAFMAYPIVRIMFGDQWDAAVPLVQILCIYAVIMTLCPFVPQTLIGLGRMDDYFKFEMVFQPVRIFLLFIGSVYSLKAVVVMYSLSAFVYFVLSFFPLRRLIRLSVDGITRAVHPSLSVTACSIVGPALVYATMDIGPTNTWIPLLTAASAAAAGWLLGVILMNHPLRTEFANLQYRFLKFLRDNVRGS